VIVLSSAWQVSAEGRADVDAALSRWGLPTCVAHTVVNGAPGSGEERRAREISAWVRSHAQACARGWVALDDLPLSSVAQPPAFVPLVPPEHFVHVDERSGLTPAAAARAVALLGGRDPAAPRLPPPMPGAELGVPRDAAAAPARPGHEVWRTDQRYGGTGAAS
jgi:hypothetical protein